MKMQQAFFLGALIITLCFISFIPFSNVEGMTYKDYYANLNNSTVKQENDIYEYADKKNNSKGNTNASSGSFIDIFKRNYKVNVTSNSDFMSALNSALASNPDPALDKVAIYNLQGAISSLSSQNAATLLGEIGNPNNLTNPRLFLQYMNWFCSNCPIYSDTCTGL